MQAFEWKSHLSYAVFAYNGSGVELDNANCTGKSSKKGQKGQPKGSTKNAIDPEQLNWILRASSQLISVYGDCPPKYSPQVWTNVTNVTNVG